MLGDRLAGVGGKRTVTSLIWASWMLALFVAHAETVTVRSGNGSVGGRDTAITFLAGPASSDFNHTLVQSDFTSAQTGPAAYILSGLGVEWLSRLSEDSSAHWVGTKPVPTKSMETQPRPCMLPVSRFQTRLPLPP